MTKVNEKYLGNRPQDREDSDAADEFLKNRPTTDHIVKTWSRSPGGRKSTLTQEAIDEIATLVAGGVTIPVAATACGHGGAWRNWNTIGKAHQEQGFAGGFGEGESPFVAWVDAVVQAKACFETNMVLTISGLHNNWRAARDLLDARIPDRWKQKQEAKITVKTEREAAQGKSTQELQEELFATLTPEEKLKLLGSGDGT